MAKIFIKDFLKKSIKDLVSMRNDLRKELFEMKMKNALRSLKQTHLIKEVKRNIARLNTALSYKINEKDGGNLK